MRPAGVSTARSPSTSPVPQTRRSVYVGTSLRWWFSSRPSGPMVSSVLYSVPRPAPRSTRSLTPTTSVTSASRAIAASASNAAPGTVTLAAAMRAKTAFAGPWSHSAASRQTSSQAG